MTVSIKGVPGGAQKASVGTTPVAVDLTALAGRRVKIWSNEDDLQFSFAASSASTTLVTAGDQAASTTALVADRVALGTGGIRLVSKKYPFLIVRHATLTGTVRVKPISAVDRGEG